MDQATHDEVRRKMADYGRDRFSVLIDDTEEARRELFDLVHDGGAWWSDGGPRDPISGGKQRVRFVREGSPAADEAQRAADRRRSR